jgi:hypothetical protein
MSKKQLHDKDLDASRAKLEPGESHEFHVTWESPVLELSGYAASARAALQGLEEAGVRVRLIPMNHDQGDRIER